MGAQAQADWSVYSPDRIVRFDKVIAVIQPAKMTAVALIMRPHAVEKFTFMIGAQLWLSLSLGKLLANV